MRLPHTISKLWLQSFSGYSNVWDNFSLMNDDITIALVVTRYSGSTYFCICCSMIPSGGHHLPRDLNFFVSFVCSAWFAMFFAVFLFGLFGLPCFMQFVCSACFAMFLYLYCLAWLPLFLHSVCLVG